MESYNVVCQMKLDVNRFCQADKISLSYREIDTNYNWKRTILDHMLLVENANSMEHKYVLRLDNIKLSSINKAL